jgi:UDP-glucose 4-epimerase
MSSIDNSRILITGGTGSLGNALVERLLSGTAGNPKVVTVFSRDELKQAELKAKHKGDDRLKFVIGNVRDRHAVELALMNIDIVFNAAAMKRVETCERFPAEAIKTNCLGVINIVEAIRKYELPVKTVVGVSSDKGCSPVNNYGCTKFLQEKVLLSANQDCENTRFVSVCYGNVMGSRGSVIPIFKKLIAEGKPVTIHDPNMTRFLISLDQAVDTLLAVLNTGNRGEIYVPVIPSATIEDIADVLIDHKGNQKVYVGVGQGEKMHEILINEVEITRTILRDGYYVVTPHIQEKPAIMKEYNSKDYLLDKYNLRRLFCKYGLLGKGNY